MGQISQSKNISQRNPSYCKHKLRWRITFYNKLLLTYRRTGLRLRIHCLRGLRVYQRGWACILSRGIRGLSKNGKNNIFWINMANSVLKIFIELLMWFTNLLFKLIFIITSRNPETMQLLASTLNLLICRCDYLIPWV